MVSELVSTSWNDIRNGSPEGKVVSGLPVVSAKVNVGMRSWLPVDFEFTSPHPTTINDTNVTITVSLILPLLLFVCHRGTRIILACGPEPATTKTEEPKGAIQDMLVESA